MDFQDGAFAYGLSRLICLQVFVLWRGTNSLPKKDPMRMKVGELLFQVTSEVCISFFSPTRVCWYVLFSSVTMICLLTLLMAPKAFLYLMGFGCEGMTAAATSREATNRAPYRWSPLCLFLRSKAEPWVCQCAFSRFVVACSRCPKSGYSYWE